MKHAPATLPPPSTPATPPPMASDRDPEPLLIRDLLLDFDELSALLGTELSREHWLDAFLLAAGMNQILEDHLHRDLADLDRIRSALRGVAGSLGKSAAHAVSGLRFVGLAARAIRPAERRLVAWQLDLDRAVALLAAASQDGMAREPSGPLREVISILGAAPRLPAQLRSSIIRLPTCFRSLDQRPADLRRLVEEFASRHPDRQRPVLVVGLRTSGSYLAPLYKHFLVAAGYAHVGAMTLRPGQRLLEHESSRLEWLARRGGLVLLTDDPPKTGSSITRAARALEAAGVPAGSVKLLLPTLSDAEDGIPHGLSRYETFALPMRRWEVQEQLDPGALRETLGTLLTGRQITLSETATKLFVDGVKRVEVLDLGPRSDLKAGSPVRRHVRALLRVTLRGVDGHEVEHLIYVKGVGLGYFGHHSLTIARSLASFLPDLYGVSCGLLFREWLPEAARISEPSPGPDLPRAIGRYVAARNDAMRASVDKSLRTAGLNPIWQRIADLLGKSFGRQRVVFRPALHSAARKLLAVRNPSVIDGSMAASQWFGRADGAKVKVDYDERAFSNQDTVIDQLYSYDPVFDLAVAAADHELEADPEKPESGFHTALASAFESASSTSIAPERWMLYQLLHLTSHVSFVESLWREVCEGAIPRLGLDALDATAVLSLADRASRAAARVDQRYLAQTLLADAECPASGPLCAIDIDGVLETGWLGYSSATAQGVRALRRLMRHGYRPVVVTGRSLGEVMDRCHAYGLAGGVAEYGAAIYDCATGGVVELLEQDENDALRDMRARLTQLPGVHVEHGYRRIVRASLISNGSRKPVPDELIDEIRTDDVRVVHGLRQSDFVPDHINKGRGVRALAALLSGGEPPSHPRLAFAMGDSLTDLSMLAEAGASFGPANSDLAVKASGARITRSDRQRGLSEAISEFLQHEPDRCASCRAGQVSPDASLLLTALSAGGAGRWQKLGLGIRLAMQASR